MLPQLEWTHTHTHTHTPSAIYFNDKARLKNVFRRPTYVSGLVWLIADLEHRSDR